MTEPTTTERIAVSIRDLKRKHRHTAEACRRPSSDLGALLRERLPEVSEADAAAVLLHVSTFLGPVYNALRRGGMSDYAAALALVDVLGIAGEEIHSGIQRRAS